MAGIFGEFFLVSVPHETKHENSSKNSGKLRNSGQNSGQKSEKFGELSFCNFSDLKSAPWTRESQRFSATRIAMCTCSRLGGFSKDNTPIPEKQQEEVRESLNGGLANGGLRHLSTIVHDCLRLSSFCDENSPQKGAQKATKVHNCRRLCANCGVWP